MNSCSVGVKVNKSRGFSLYDIEQFLKEAGAEKVNERAILCLEKELHDTVNQLLEGATVCANHAGRSRVIKRSDVKLARRMPRTHMYGNALKRRRRTVKLAPTLMLRPDVIGQHASPIKVKIRQIE